MATLTRDPVAGGDVIPWLLRLYPSAWRDRYGAELADLIAARPPSRRDQLDIVRGALDAHLHPQLADAPARRVGGTSDRVLAFGAVAVGALFSTWAGIIMVASPRWGELGSVGNDIVALSYGAGLLGAIIAIGVLLGIVYRHVVDLRPIGAIGALVAAAGFLAMIANAGATAVPLLVLGTLGMSPGLARAVGRTVALLVVGSTLFLASAMFGFVGSGGQELLWLWMLAGYGPSWVLLGVSLRRGPRAGRGSEVVHGDPTVDHERGAVRPA
jgi:hypothetical protein